MRSPTAVAVAAVLLAVLHPPGSGQAQQPPPPGDTAAVRDSAAFRLPPIFVVASIAPGAVGPAVGSGLPARFATLSAAAVETWEPRLLSDALASQPGVSLYDDLGSAFKTTLVTRGFTVSPVVGLPQGVSVFLDGVPVNEPDAGQVNFDLLPLEHVERIEFLSGTASLLGPNSMGGAVNLVTRRGDRSRRGHAEASAGSHGLLELDAAAADARPAWRYYVGAGHRREDGWRILTGARASHLFANLDRTAERAGATIQLNAASSRAETAGSLPASVYAVRPDSNLSAGDFDDLEQLHAAATGYAVVGGGMASMRLYYRRHSAERFNVNQAVDPDVRSFSSNRSAGASGDWRVPEALGLRGLATRLGAGGSLHETRVRILAERLEPGLTTDVESPIQKGQAYGMAEYVLGRATVSGGVRFDAVRIPFRNRLDPRRDTTSTYFHWSPRLGASLRVGRGGSVYASAGGSFRAPAVIELACADPNEPCPLPFALGDDPPLDAVTATSYEAGLQWLLGPALVTATLYRTRVANEIFLFPYHEEGEPEGSTIDGYFANVPRSRREGVEIGARLDLGDGHSAYANYAYTRATFRTAGLELFSIREVTGGQNEIHEGSRMPLVPDHTFAAGAMVDLPGPVSLAMALRYVGERFLRGDEANVEPPLRGFWNTDLGLSAEAGTWEAQLIVGNAFDHEHATFGTFNINHGDGGTLERFLTPGTPRTVRLLVRRWFRRSATPD